jgi:hypothetical protein
MVSNRLTIEQAAKQAGCWLEGSRGWAASGELVNIAARHGMPLDDDDKALVAAYLARQESVTLPSGQHVGDVAGLVVDQGELADKAEAYLNEHVAPYGFEFGWHDGEFFLQHAAWFQQEDTNPTALLREFAEAYREYERLADRQEDTSSASVGDMSAAAVMAARSAADLVDWLAGAALSGDEFDAPDWLTYLRIMAGEAGSDDSV